MKNLEIKGVSPHQNTLRAQFNYGDDKLYLSVGGYATHLTAEEVTQLAQFLCDVTERKIVTTFKTESPF